jgi:adenine-specific DNA-methyltransferase
MNLFLQGDCLSVLPTLPSASVDFVLTDPPYMVNFKDRRGRSISNDVNDDWLRPAFFELFRVMRPNSLCVSFYGWSRADRFLNAWLAVGFRPVGHLVFPKPYASSSRFLQYQHESAFLLAKGRPAVPASPPSDVLPWKYTGNALHPTQKPVSSLVPLIEAFCPVNGVTLDPFACSGSTCAAAVSIGRRYIGIELDGHYYAVAKKRLALFERSQARDLQAA